MNHDAGASQWGAARKPGILWAILLFLAAFLISATISWSTSSAATPPATPNPPTTAVTEPAPAATADPKELPAKDEPFHLSDHSYLAAGTFKLEPPGVEPGQVPDKSWISPGALDGMEGVQPHGYTFVGLTPGRTAVLRIEYTLAQDDGTKGWVFATRYIPFTVPPTGTGSVDSATGEVTTRTPGEEPQNDDPTEHHHA